MNLPRLLALAALASAFALSACGNKADLYLPPPPDDEVFDDGREPLDEGALEDVIEDEAASQDASGMPLPPPTGDGPEQQPVPPTDDDDPDPAG
mgnify:CR=1 FL=1